MSETSIIVVVAIIAAILGYALARVRAREGAVGQGRLTVDSQRTTTTKNLAVDPSDSSAVADALESMLASLPETESARHEPGTNMSIKTNVTMMFKLPNKEVAEAVAERERAKGMSVVVTPPDATDQNWRVTSTRSQVR